MEYKLCAVAYPLLIPTPDHWPAAWAALAPQVLAKAQPPPPAHVLTLRGELGAGKTTFVKTIARALGYAGDVTSPTFSLVQEYPTPHGMLYHFDLYRAQSVEEVLDLGFEEYLDAGYLAVVEWPAVAAPILGAYAKTEIEIQHRDGGGREVVLL